MLRHLALLSCLSLPLAIDNAKASSPDVLCVQRHLNALGFDSGAEDGLLGGKSVAAGNKYRSSTKAPSQAWHATELSKENAAAWCAGMKSVHKGALPQLQFWSPPKDVEACPNSSFLNRLPTKRTIYGWKKRNTAFAFMEQLGLNLTFAIGNENYDTRAFAVELIKAAKSKAFTRTDFEGPGGPSPVFATSLVLISSSYAFSLFDQRRAWKDNERRLVIAWGNRLDRNQNKKRKYASPDSIAAIGAARVAWGAATGQKATFNSGLRDIRIIMRMLKKAGYFERNPRDNNEDVALMVLAAEAAVRSGVDVYSWKRNGLTLHDAVERHARRTIKDGPKAFRETTGHVGRYYRSNGVGAHLAWIPIYLSRFHDTDAARAVRDLNTALRRIDFGFYNGASVGGPTECLWGRIE